MIKDIYIDGKRYTDCVEYGEGEIFAGFNKDNTFVISITDGFTFSGDAFKHLESKFFSGNREDCDNVANVKLTLDCCDTELEYKINFRSITEYCCQDCTVTAMLLDKDDDQYKCLRDKVFWKDTGFLATNKAARICYCNRYSLFVQILYITLYAILLPITLILEAIEHLFNIEIPSLDDLERLVTGCTREHPSFYVKDILKHSANRCRLEFKSSILCTQPYDCMVLFAAQHEEGAEPCTVDYIEGNLPNETAISLLELLKPVFNADYRIIDGCLIFEREDYFEKNLPVLADIEREYEKGNAEEAPCYRTSTDEACAYARYTVCQDALDKQGNKLNDCVQDIVEWNDPPSPFQDGECTNDVQFGAVAGMYDKKSSRFIDNFIQDVTFTLDAEGLMLLSDGVASCYKLLVVDPASKSEKCQKIIRRPIGNDRYEYNYPLSFQESNNEGLYQNFHYIDNPRNEGFAKFEVEDFTFCPDNLCDWIDIAVKQKRQVAVQTKFGKATGQVNFNCSKGTITLTDMAIIS